MPIGTALLIVFVVSVISFSGSETTELETFTESRENTAPSEGEFSEPVKPGETITVELPGLPEEARKLEMVLIPAGTFTMGSPENMGGSLTDINWPVHKVTIGKAFYLGKYELTQAQWKAVMKDNFFHKKRKHMSLGLNYPAVKVSWNKCRSFIKRLNALNLGTFRMPTEAEWEYACRAGTNTRFSFGDTTEHADKYMWWNGNNDPEGQKEVGLKLPNPWGLYDMHGNVMEWCSDRWEKPREREPQTDPQGPYRNSLHTFWTRHVFRAGSFNSSDDACRSASRHYEQAIDYHYSLGFRLVREHS